MMLNSVCMTMLPEHLLGAMQTKDARFFCCRNSDADISKPHTFKWGPLADEFLNTAQNSPTEKNAKRCIEVTHLT